MSFYAQMPDSYQLVLNSDHPLIKRVLDDENKGVAEQLKPVLSELKGQPGKACRSASVAKQEEG